MKPTALKTNEF